MVTSQVSGFNQQGKVTHEMQDSGLNIAHSSLPLNSKVKMVNVSTGKEVEVTVTRTIPASAGRIADVSSSVWQALGLTSGSDARISTIVSAKPPPEDAPSLASQSGGSQSGGAGSQSGGSQFAGGAQGDFPQFAGSQSGGAQLAGAQGGSQSAGSSGARTAQGGSGGSGGTGSDFFGNMPAGVKFENNNNFTFYNGYPMAGMPPAQAYTQPGQQGQGSSYYDTGSAQPYANYSQPGQQGQGYGAGSSQPYVTYEPRQQPNQPVVIIDNWPMPAQPYVTYEPGQRPELPAAIVDNWTQPDQPVYETRSLQGGVNDIWAQVAMPPELLAKMTRNKPVVSSETRTQPARPVATPKRLLPRPLSELTTGCKRNSRLNPAKHRLSRQAPLRKNSRISRPRRLMKSCRL